MQYSIYLKQIRRFLVRLAVKIMSLTACGNLLAANKVETH
jgi:hypothetical protein